MHLGKDLFKRGYDNGFDYRQRPFTVPEYSKLIYPNVIPKQKIKIGILNEGVDLSDQNVQDVFTKATEMLKLNEYLEVSAVSMPGHATSSKVYSPFIMSGAFGSMIDGCGFGTGLGGFQSHSLVAKMREGYKSHGHELAEPLKLNILIGDYIKEKYGPYHYAKAATLLAQLNLEYNKLFDKYDVIIMPTLNNTPCKIPDKDTTIKERLSRACNMIENTAVFDITGHPALSLNCGFDKEFPVGMMVVGKHYDEVAVLNAASIFESIFKECIKN